MHFDNTINKQVNFLLPSNESLQGKPNISVKVINFSYTEKNALDSQSIHHKATVLDGTFSLKDRVKTLKDHKTELENACSTGERVKKAIISLLTVSVIVGCIASMVFGGPAGVIVGSIVLGFFMLISGMVLEELVLGEIIQYNLFFPITMPILFTYYMLTRESKCQNKVEISQKDVNELVNYILNKKEEINQWLIDRKNEFINQIAIEKAGVNSHLSNQELQNIVNRLENLNKQIAEVDNLIEKLKESYELAQQLSTK